MTQTKCRLLDEAKTTSSSSSSSSTYSSFSLNFFCFPCSVLFSVLSLSLIFLGEGEVVFLLNIYHCVGGFLCFSFFLVDRVTFKNIRCCYSFRIFQFERTHRFLLFCFFRIFHLFFNLLCT